jgi:hypothetical protein
MAAPSPLDLETTFQTKYEEFATDLLETFPELEEAIRTAVAIEPEDRMAKYKELVFMTTKRMDHKNLEVAPGTVLPGVTLTAALWATAGRKTRMAIHEYVSILNIAVAFGGGADTEDFTKEWAERMMRDARASMSKIDFDGLSKKFFEMFGSKGDSLPPLPEKFLKGKLAKLAEDMVKEFNPEDFGLKKEDLEECERDPTRAFEILMKASLGDPQMIQRAMGRVAKKLQEKVNRGELKPQELVAEAEELMKEFQEHPAFVELMSTFKTAFGGGMGGDEDDLYEMSKKQGKDNEGRLALVKARLRKKLDAKKNKIV